MTYHVNFTYKESQAMKSPIGPPPLHDEQSLDKDGETVGGPVRLRQSFMPVDFHLCDYF